MKYLIFLDIDGTILSEKGVHPRTIDGIRAAMGRGHLVFINTGRGYHIVPSDFLQLVPHSGIAAGLGTYIRCGDQVLKFTEMSRELCFIAMEASKKFHLPIGFEGDNNSVGYNGGAWYLDKKDVVDNMEEIYTHAPGIRINKATYMRRLSEEALAMLSPHFEIVNHVDTAEIAPKGCTKSTAISFLMDYFGIDRDHVIAMGDSNNDIQMLEAAGIAVVMENGLPEIKKLADFITLDCREGGVGYAIEELVLKSSSAE